MTHVFSGAVLLCLAAVTASRADVTVRYSYDVKPGAMFPPQIAEKLKAQINEMIGTSVPMRVKGNRALSTVMGLTSISDFDGEMITLIDAKNKRYATVQKDEYLRTFMKSQEQQSKAMPEQARRMIEQTKTDVKKELTGRKETIQGIETEERQVTMSMGVPGAPPMRMVFSIFSPTPEQVERN
ncbi:MAG TPA: hypothetical protein VER03_05535, partial [Bryobacteraceae bacterium]|nr:hypothetical protein [Bryobacteraceae bacterium]